MGLIARMGLLCWVYCLQCKRERERKKGERERERERRREQSREIPHAPPRNYGKFLNVQSPPKSSTSLEEVETSNCIMILRHDELLRVENGI